MGCANFAESASRIYENRIDNLKHEKASLMRQLVSQRLRNKINNSAKGFYRDRLREVEAKNENRT